MLLNQRRRPESLANRLSLGIRVLPRCNAKGGLRRLWKHKVYRQHRSWKKDNPCSHRPHRRQDPVSRFPSCNLSYHLPLRSQLALRVTLNQHSTATQTCLISVSRPLHRDRLARASGMTQLEAVSSSRNPRLPLLHHYPPPHHHRSIVRVLLRPSRA
jgi:hypothetical protein